jgi:hypothetical protein
LGDHHLPQAIAILGGALSPNGELALRRHYVRPRIDLGRDLLWKSGRNFVLSARKNSLDVVDRSLGRGVERRLVRIHGVDAELRGNPLSIGFDSFIGLDTKPLIAVGTEQRGLQLLGTLCNTNPPPFTEFFPWHAVL